MHFLFTEPSLTLAIAWTQPDQRSSGVSAQAHGPRTPEAVQCVWTEGSPVHRQGVDLFPESLNVASVAVVEEC